MIINFPRDFVRLHMSWFLQEQMLARANTCAIEYMNVYSEHDESRLHAAWDREEKVQHIGRFIL